MPTIPTPPYGLPGAAWQPWEPVPPIPGQPDIGARLAGSGPQIPSPWLTPQLPAGQAPAGALGAGGVPAGALGPAPTPIPAPAAPRPAPNMFGSRAGQRVGTEPVASMQDVRGRGVPRPFGERAMDLRVKAGAQRMAASEGARTNPNWRFADPSKARGVGGATSGAPRTAGPSNPQAGANLMEMITGKRPTASASTIPPPVSGPANPLAGTRFSWAGSPVTGLPGKIGRGATFMTAPIMGAVLGGKDIRSDPLGRMTGALGTGLATGGVTTDPATAAATGLTTAGMQGSLELSNIAQDESRPWWERAGGLLGRASFGTNPITNTAGFAADLADTLTGGKYESVVDMIPGLSWGAEMLGIGEGVSDTQAPPDFAAIRADLPTSLANLGVSEQNAALAIDQLNQDIALMRLQAENGLAFRTDENGEQVAISPDEVEREVIARFITGSLPELIDMDRQQAETLARAAAFQSTIGDVMAPYAAQADALANLYPQMLVGPNTPANMVEPLQRYADLMGASARRDAASYGALAQMIPMQMAIDEQMALQAQIDQMLLSQAMREDTSTEDPTQADAILGG